MVPEPAVEVQEADEGWAGQHVRPRDALAWRLSPWLPDRDGERGNPDLSGPSEPAHAGGAEAQPSPGPPPLLPSPSPRLEPPHDAISGGWSRG